jgi:hypothetical protein
MNQLVKEEDSPEWFTLQVLHLLSVQYQDVPLRAPSCCLHILFGR